MSRFISSGWDSVNNFILRVSKTKRLILVVFSSIILAFCIVEVLVGSVIGYPVSEFHHDVYWVKGARGGAIRKPRAKIFNVETMSYTNLNNVGLPGSDIDPSDEVIYVLGSSYIEALQYDPQHIATSIFQNKLKQDGFGNSVYNLGDSGASPYDSYFLLEYYKRVFRKDPHCVILVINSDYQSWLQRPPKPLTFSIPRDFGIVDRRLQPVIVNRLLGSSSLAHLLYESHRQHKNRARSGELDSNEDDHSPVLSHDLETCIIEFAKKYPRFSVVSIVNSKVFNDSLSQFCFAIGVDCSTTLLMRKEYLINGTGHLNLQGNLLLGDELYNSYLELQHKY